MPRPRTQVGTFGTVHVTDSGPPFEASAYFRDADGIRRRVRRYGKTKTKARDALKAALADRQKNAGSALTADTLVSDLADEWMTRMERSSKAVGTKQQYRRTIEANVKPAIGALRIGEVRVSIADRALQTINERHGYSVAKQARAVMSGMFGLAVRLDLLPANPVRDAEKLTRSKTAKKPRALTPDQVDQISDQLRTIPRAVQLDLPDLAEFMLMTGARIGEALACRDGKNSDGEPLLDLERGTWEINATVVRVKGQGLVVQERPKTEKGWRVLALPPAAVELAARRIGEERLRPGDVTVLDAAERTRVEQSTVVFPSPFRRRLRDPNNCEGDFREIFDGLDCELCAGTGYQLDGAGRFVLSSHGRKVRCNRGPWSWLTSHVFRKTVATRMEEAGCTPRQVADQLGHSKVSITQDVYFGRGVVCEAAARILDR
jgi:integrase